MPKPITNQIAAAAEPFETPDSADITALVERIANARLVLLGEATHGTSEFYRMRARITRELVEHHGFDLVAVEADWPDAQRIDTYVRHLEVPPPEWQAFARFPTWMWRNQEVRDFIDWLREHNSGLDDPGARIGFHGLDLYSMFSSMGAVLDYPGRNRSSANPLPRADVIPGSGHRSRLGVSCRSRVCCERDA